MMKSIDLLLFQVWGSQNYFFLGCRQASEMLVLQEDAENEMVRLS
jgi:hypothetical protein